jgi:hypothetical protein
VLTGTLLACAGWRRAICLLALLLSWPPLLAKGRRRRSPQIPRVVPLLLALAAVGMLLAAPADNLVSRRIEARADVHALDLTRDVETFVATSSGWRWPTCRTSTRIRWRTPSSPPIRVSPSGWRWPGSGSACAGARERTCREHARRHQRLPAAAGGIQAYVHNLAVRLPAGDVVVYASDWPGGGRLRRGAAFEVVRHPTTVLLPTAGRAAADPCGWLGRAPATCLVGLLQLRLLCSPAGWDWAAPSLRSYGHETGCALLPGARGLLRRPSAGTSTS